MNPQSQLSGFTPPEPFKHYSKTPKNLHDLKKCFRQLIVFIFVRLHNDKYKNKLNLQDTCKDYGIHDTKVTQFFQDINLLKLKGKGRGSQWFWVGDVKPTPMVATEIARKWFIWKNGNKVRSFPIKEDYKFGIPTTTKTYTTNTTKPDQTEDAPIIQYKIPEFDEQLQTMELIDNMLQLINLFKNQKQSSKGRFAMLLGKIDSLQEDVTRSLNSYIQISMLFGLVKFKCPIKFN